MVLIPQTLVRDDLTTKAIVDIVFVHGFEEKEKDAWIDQGTGVFWPKDLLPLNDLGARVLTFGYDASVSSFFGGGGSDRILGHAHTLVADLEARRSIDNASERPIIFVCHGIGGILVKRALVYSASRISKKVEHLYSIFVSTYGILFLGTPHNGIDNTSMHLMVRSEAKDAPGEILASIGENSETLQNITDQFAPMTKQFHLYFFWEELETSAETVKGYVVREESAAPIWDDVERSGIHATHSQMCKFGSIESPGYKIVLAALLRYTNDSHSVIGNRWQEAKKFLALQRQNEVCEILGPDFQRGQHVVYPVKKDNGIRNKYFIIPHNVSSIYTRRNDIEEGFQDKFLATNETVAPRQQKRVVIYGLGGSGKTQFCLNFVQDNRDKFWGIFWIDASSAENAERAFSELGRLGGMGDTCTNGLYWLTGLTMPWLLVLDNADDPDINYSRFFPPGERGHILITSRNQNCKIYATIGHHEFKDMEQDDAITLLLKAACVNITDTKLRELAKPIAKTLGYLPLALIQAGASIRQNVCSLEDYLDLYSSHRKQILSEQPSHGTDQYKYTIFTTWEVSFRMIEKQGTGLAADAIEVLHIFAFLHFEQVPSSIFERAWKNLQSLSTPVSKQSLLQRLFNWSPLASLLAVTYGRLSSSLGNNNLLMSDDKLPQLLLQRSTAWDGYRLRQALAVLSTFSLIYKDSNTDRYSMHPMVHFWARDRLEKADQQLWSKITTSTLAHSITTKRSRSDHDFRRSLMPHIDACLHGAHTAPLLDGNTNITAIAEAAKFAMIYSECGRWKEARDIQEQVLKAQTISLGPKHMQTLSAMTDLAWSYWNLGRPSEALKLQQQVMNVGLEAYGPADPTTLKAMDNLASTLWLCGQMAEAEELGIKAMNGMDKILGRGHPDTLMAMHNLGRVYMHRGRLKDAETLQIEILGARRKMLGSDHLDTLMTMQDLGMSHHALKRFKDAEGVLFAVLEARKRILGQEHAYTLWAVNDLSKIYSDQGRAVEAERLLVDILDIVVRTLGKEHIGMQMTQRNLARAYIGQGRWADANTLLTDLIEIQNRTVGPEHPDTLSAIAELARTYRHLKGVDKAQELYGKVIEAMKNKLGPEDPQTLSAMCQLVTILKEKGDMATAAKLEEEASQGEWIRDKLIKAHAKTF